MYSAKNLLITMGGIDLGNATERVLDTLHQCKLSSEFQITIVMGSFAARLAAVKDKAVHTPYKTRVLASVNNMAELMAEADLAIGAAGSTSWERCCLGLPTLQVVLADNQRLIASALQQAGAAKSIELDTLNHSDCNSLLEPLLAPNALKDMSAAASLIADGRGTARVASVLAKKQSS